MFAVGRAASSLPLCLTSAFLPVPRFKHALQGSEEEFKNATEAYGVLSDEEQRKIYDRTLGVRKVNSPSSR